MNCGKIVERRDQVLITTFLALTAFNVFYFFQQVAINKWTFFQTATHVMILPSRNVSEMHHAVMPMCITSCDDEQCICRCFIFFTRFVTKCWFAPWRHWRFTSDWSTTFTTTVRVIVRVHYNTTNFRTFAHPTGTTCFTDLDQVRDLRYQQNRLLRGKLSEY